MKRWMSLILASVLILGGCGAPVNQTPDGELILAETSNDEIMTAVDIPDNLIRFSEKKIEIPELTDDYEIWLFADSHIIIEDNKADKKTKEYMAERIPVFDNDTGYSSAALFSSFINKANKEMPDLILFGGDIIDFPSEANVQFLISELDRLEVPYVMTFGNHDWTFPWEYMTEKATEVYRSMISRYMTGNFGIGRTEYNGKKAPEVFGSDYYKIAEYEDLQVIAMDNSSNQVENSAMDAVETFVKGDKPVVLLTHVPMSTEALIAKAKDKWSSPVTLGMQVHGGIAPNEESTRLWHMIYDEETPVRALLSGHVHFPYEEAISDSTVEIITDAAYKGRATRILLQGGGEKEEHQYFCDKFTLTVDDKQFDLKEVDPEISSVSELYPIADEQLYILGRVDENVNSLMIYDFKKEEFVFVEHGTTMCWVQGKYKTVRYLKNNVVYDLEGNIIYEGDESFPVTMIEYVEEDFLITVKDMTDNTLIPIWI